MRSNRVIRDGDQSYEVIERGEALAPHPHPSQNKRLTAFAGVTRVLVTDDKGNPRDGVECDECGHPFWAASDDLDDLAKATQSARGHAASHSENFGGPMYPKETLAKLIRLVRRAEMTTGTRNKNVIAAEQLNREGVPTYRGDPWTASAVSALYNRWHKEIKVRVSVPRPASSPPVSPAPTRVKVRRSVPTEGEVRNHGLSAEEATEALLRAFSQAIHGMTQLQKALEVVSPVMARMQELLNENRQAAAAAATIDPEVLAKAEQFDALQSMILGKKS